MKIIYRISDVGYKKVKPHYINNEACLLNAIQTFKDVQFIVIADNCSDDTKKMIVDVIKDDDILHVVNVGHGAGTFNIALDTALQMDDDEIVYFLENDYLHKQNSTQLIHEGIELGGHFITLYDHPDKYLDPKLGGNPFCEGNAEDTRVYLSKSTHWKITNSTTMTFASKVSTLRRSNDIMRKYTADTYPRDFEMFIELRKQNMYVLSSIPGHATHGETAWMCPLTDWDNII